MYLISIDAYGGGISELDPSLRSHATSVIVNRFGLEIQLRDKPKNQLQKVEETFSDIEKKILLSQDKCNLEILTCVCSPLL